MKKREKKKGKHSEWSERIDLHDKAMIFCFRCDKQ